MPRSRQNKVHIITAALLRRWPLPQPLEDDDKEGRGRVTVVGGAPEMPGAIILAATAALRAGAGKVRICAGSSIAQLVAQAVPEARVISLPETKTGAIALRAAAKIVEHTEGARAVLIGPGMIDERAIARLMKSVLPRIGRATLVLDAGALTFLYQEPHGLHKLDAATIITPHAGEMASICGRDKEAVLRAAALTAREAADELRAVVALKGRETFIAAPGGSTYCNRAGNIGLATAGSGDTLSGIIAGLAARDAEALQATVWGVHLHARAGDRLARRMGRLGFLARELLAEIPPLMSELDGRKKR